MTKHVSAPLRLTPHSPDIGEARRIAALNLTNHGMRLHLIFASLITMTLWVGCLYLTENLFAVVPWVALHQNTPALFRLLNILFYVIDGMIILFLGFPLLFGCANIFSAAGNGKQLALTALFEAFGNGRTYARSIAVMLIILAPRALAVLLLRALWLYVLPHHTIGLTLLCLPLMLLPIALITWGLGLDDAYLPLVLHQPHMGIWALYKQSVRLTRPHLFRIWCFKLCYLLWGLLSIVSMGVLFFGHALPFYCLSHAAWTDNTYQIT